MNYAGNTEILMITKTICVLLCFQSSYAQNILFLTKVIFIQGAFKNIQGLLCKIQGLVKSCQGYPTIFQFSRTFQGHHAFSMTFQGPCEP